MILIMRSWTELNVVLTMKYRLKFQKHGSGVD